MYDYYELYKNSKDPIPLRITIVREAKKIGIKPTARKYKTSPSERTIAICNFLY